MTPWQLDGTALEEDVFNLAVAQPLDRRALDIAGCRILVRQFREQAETRQARVVALAGRGGAGATSQACRSDLHTLLPVRDATLQHGPPHPATLAPRWPALRLVLQPRPD